MIPIKVPPLGESIVEAIVSRWVKQPGEAIVAGDTIVELETDKVNVEVPALKAGVLASQAKKEGETVKVDDVLGQLDDAAVPATATPAKTAPATVGATAAPPAAAGGAAMPPTKPAADVRASPAAQKLAADRNIDLSKVPGTGKGGVVSKADVLNSADVGAGPVGAGQRPAPTAPAPASSVQAMSNGERETREKMTTRRKRIAENLLQSQLQTAHLTTFNEIDMSAVSALRERLRERIEKKHGVKLSYMPFFVRAACQALSEFPSINAQIEGDSIIYRHYVNMGIAVAADQGLVVPVIRDADRKGMLDVAREIAALGARGRDGKLTIEDLTGGTFTITNGGVFGSLVSTPILNYPQVGILGLHKIQDRPIALSGQVVIRPMMYVALSYDHRLVEGAHAVQFLVRVKELMEDPAAMLVG